jgi:transglutaminase-like putative cysteine protease
MDGAWHGFDPRNDKRLVGRVPIARGRGAVDVPISDVFGPNTPVGFRLWTDEVVAAAKPVGQGALTSSHTRPGQVRRDTGRTRCRSAYHPVSVWAA